MPIKLVVISLIMFFGFSYGSVAATEVSANKCAKLKDSKKRLVCFDNATKQSSAAEVSSNGAVVKIKSNDVPIEKTISVEAGLVFRSGDVKPVARTVFYILDDSVISIFSNAGLKPFSSRNEENTPGYNEQIYPQLVISAFAMIHTRIEDLTADNAQVQGFRDFHSHAIMAIQPHIVQSGTTDFSGRVKFGSLKPGVYYLMGVYKTPNGEAVWNVRVDARDNETLVVLDQNNASHVK